MKASFALFKNFLRGEKEGLDKMMANPLKNKIFYLY